MKQYLQNLLGGGMTYESPRLEIIEIDVENVICQDSGTFGIRPWENDDDELNW